MSLEEKLDLLMEIVDEVIDEVKMARGTDAFYLDRLRSRLQAIRLDLTYE